jgi:hypothetical protein
MSNLSEQQQLEQEQHISTLKDSGYDIPTYTELMPKLEELVPSTRLD